MFTSTKAHNNDEMNDIKNQAPTHASQPALLNSESLPLNNWEGLNMTKMRF